MKNRYLPIALSLFALNVAGCAGFGSLRDTVKRNMASDVGPSREKRKEAVTRDFDRQRDDTQFDAAASWWKRGDEENCRRMLVQLLDRNPNHRRARLLLADVYLFKGQLEQSAAELHKVLATDPKDAVVQHALAEVLDVCGRRQEALTHYALAAQLDPTNEMFALSNKTAQSVEPTPTSPSRSVAAAKAKWTASSGGHPNGSNGTVVPSSEPTVVASSTPAGSYEQTVWRIGDDPTAPANSRLLAAPARVDEWVQPVEFETTVGKTVNAPERVPASDSLALTPRAIPQPETQTASATPNNLQNPQSPLQLAVAALAQGDSERAIDEAGRGLSQTPDQAAALYRVLGAAHYRRGEYHAAQAALAQALSLDKSDALSYFLMGSTLEKLKDRQAAARHFAEAARLDGRFAN
jgi:tetratricopeptide (TPR) repeat protein